MPFGHLLILFVKIQILCLSLSCVAFMLLSCMSCSCILDINPLLDMWFSNIPYHSIYCLFILFPVKKLFTLIQSTCSFCFCFPCLRRPVQKDFAKTYVLPMFFSSNFMVSCLTLKFSIHFWEIFVYGLSLAWTSFFLSFLHVAVWFSQHHLLMRWSFLMYVLCPFVIS